MAISRFCVLKIKSGEREMADPGFHTVEYSLRCNTSSKQMGSSNML